MIALEKLGAQLEDPAKRRAVYRVATAVVLVLVLHKVITADDAAAYLQAAAIALGVVPAELAARNVEK